ncbi:hypothetical protein J31TS4_25440 [Paenibacillus sp. J31TS4]|uniref:sensor histidine kinase n=1 Tax=Paenibacillus sp. J31TS4 TaxID=2807195 RepID=UPI001B09DE5E|nr:histidine kinase [Paenibacillus sp. J31TS4]GIP39264.1 hypothetical protein J31TS4_25440 [Paenibacillus sp. J31TS4]
MKYPLFKWFTILLPTIIIGGFEFLRHSWLLSSIPMGIGNFYITGLTFVLSFLFATWMFRRIEDTNARLSEERARRAVYEERERLAAELHDNIAQTLFFLNVKLQKGQLEEARSIISSINGDLRQAIFNLRSLPEDGVGFEERIRRWLDEWSMVAGVEAGIYFDLNGHLFTSAEEVQLFGTIQEAFTNIRKHARATQAELQLVAKDDNWMLRVTDNGIGMPVTEEEQQNRYGVSLMRQRAAQLGAVFQLHGRSCGGTELVLAKKRGRTLQ